MKARHAELARMLKLAASAAPDAEVEAEEALLDALQPYLDAAGYHTEDRSSPQPKPESARPRAAKAAKCLASQPAPKVTITIE